MIENKLPELYF